MHDHYITGLLNRFFNGTISSEEKDILIKWILESEEHEQFHSLIEKSWQQFEPNEELPPAKVKELFGSILYQLKTNKQEPLHVNNLNRRRWKRMIAAASILFILASAGYFLFFHQNSKSTNQIAVIKQPPTRDIAPPQTVNAILTLANGEKIILDSSGNGTLATQGNTKVVKLADGRIAYHSAQSSGKVQYNLLTVPRGSRMAQITLADGTTVWLNAGSSLEYPVAFIGKERIVEMSGEAYFEVTKNAATPFRLRKTGNNVNVQVLGTHFNVNAYDDEADIKITLLEGSVKISKSNAEKMLLPGQQAQVSDAIKIADDVDIDAVIAWKNGQFTMKGMDMATLMRQVARWYDVDIIYESGVPKKRFGGSISRDVNLLTVLQALQENGVWCRLEGKKVTVK